MRNLKRALSLALASVMLVGMMVVGTSAASFPDVTDAENVEAIEVLNAVEVMIGDNGDFRPDDNVTRNEMAVIMAKLLLGKDADNYVGTHPFTDVPEWADKYVAACYNDGIVAGREETVYDGQATVTAEEAAAMMLRALGYEKLETVGQGYPAEIVKQANKISLFSNVGANPKAPMTRNAVAQLALNTLEATMVDAEIEKDIVVEGIVTIPGSVKYTEVEVDKAGNTWAGNINNADGSSSSKYTVQLGEKLYDGKLKKDTAGKSDDYGMPAAEWTYPNVATKIGTYVSDEPIYTWTEGIEDITLGDLEKALGVTTALDVYENGADTSTDITPVKGDKTKSLAVYKGATIYAVDATGNDGMADRLCVVYPYLAKVTKVTEAKGDDDRKITMDVYSKDNGAKVASVTYETESFDKDDYVMVYVKGTMTANAAKAASALSSDIIEVKPAESVTGKISTISGNNGYAVTALTVDGTKYTVAGKANMGLDNSHSVATSDYGFKNDYTLFLSNGYLLGVKGEAEAANIDDVVYVTKTAYSNTDSYGETAYKVETVALDGTVEIVENYGWWDTDGASNGGTAERIPSNEYYYTGTSSATKTLVAGFYTTEYDSDTKSYKFTPVNVEFADITGDVKFATVSLEEATAEMKADTVSLKLEDATSGATVKAAGYLTNSTRIIFVDGTGSKLEVKTETGAIRQDLAKGTTKVLVSKDGSAYEIEAIVIIGKQVSVDDQVFYLDSTDRGTTEHGNKYRLYDLSTGEYEEVVGKASNVAGNNGYVTCTVDDDDVYTFTAVGAAASGTNKDGKYTANKSNFTRYNDLISVSGSAAISNLDASGINIINLTGNSDNDGLTIADLSADETQGFSASIYVKGEEIVAIVLTAFAGEGFEAAAPTVTLTGAGNITVGGDKTTAKTLTAGTPIAVAGWAANTDYMTLAVTQADANNTADLTTTTVVGSDTNNTGVTYTNSDGKIVIKADNQVITITVTVTDTVTGATSDYVYTANVGTPA